MQKFSSLECRDAVHVTVSIIAGGIKLCSAEPFLCETDSTKITLRSHPSSNMGSIVVNDGNVTISGVSYCSNSKNRSTFIQNINTGGNARIIIDGYDVSNEVREAIEKKKGTTTQEKDCGQREYVLYDNVTLDEISVSGSSQCVIQDKELLNVNHVRLSSSGSGCITLPSCKIVLLDISASGSSNIYGTTTTEILVAHCSGTARIYNFYAAKSAKMHASGCSSILIDIGKDTNISRSKSGSAQIVAAVRM